MRFLADLHIHSRYSIATSKDLSPEIIWKWAQLKGVTVIGTGDFTHPAWLSELRNKLAPAGNGLYSLKKKWTSDDVPSLCKREVFFLLSSEISCIYKKNGRTRKVHALVLVPDISAAAGLNRRLAKIGTLRANGRPILKLDAKELLAMVLDSSPKAMFVPAHAWTPHYSLFGAESGFDSFEECFEELTPNVHAIETGLSSDPAMNWRLSSLSGMTLISNSDAHAPDAIGREANIFDTEISYDAIETGIISGSGLVGTIEFFPQEGKYYYDGHRSCAVSMSPQESMRCGGICPVCGKKMTIGVMHRIEDLADRKQGRKLEHAPPFYSTVPLRQIIGETLGKGPKSKTVGRQCLRLLQELGNELAILTMTPLRDIEHAASPRLAEAISRVRRGDVDISPGFDGEYGRISIFDKLGGGQK